MIQTKRLILRQWQDSDYTPFAALGHDPEVMRYFPSMLSDYESHQMADKIRELIEQNGWGFWAVERRSDQAFLGFTGLHKPSAELPCSPCVEIGWRFARAYWGNGYATEAASSCVRYAFETMQLETLVSFTTLGNQRSRSVMTRIGMTDTEQNFQHPLLETHHPLCEHVLYEMTIDQYFDLQLEGLSDDLSLGLSQINVSGLP